MDATLVTVTVLSMSMAAALSAIVWRMLRLERQRSNARVAALTAAALGASTHGRANPDLNDLPLSTPGPSDGESATASPLFAAARGESPWAARFTVMLALALVVASAVLFSLAARGRSAANAATGSGARTLPAPSTRGQLELMSLQDSRQAGSLTISGVVQNPRTGVNLSHVAVTAYTFDDGGSYLASGHALLDVTALAPGEESPFTVTVPATDNVARYRVGFRDEAGRVIAHVDRRQPGAVVSNSKP